MNIWPSLFHMALHAGVFLRLDEARGIQRAMRAVAIGALDEPLGNTMMHRLRELCSHGCVAPVAKVGLRGFQ